MNPEPTTYTRPTPPEARDPSPAEPALRDLVLRAIGDYIGRVGIGLLAGLLLWWFLLLVGVLRVLIGLPFVLLAGRALGPALRQVGWGWVTWYLAGGLTAGLLAGALSPLARFKPAVFAIGAVSGVAYMIAVEVARNGWHGTRSLQDPIALVVGAVFGLACAFALWPTLTDDSFR